MNQVLQGIDTYYQLLSAVNLHLNTTESNIFLPNPSPAQMSIQTLTTPQGLVIPCTGTGIKMLGSPIGTLDFSKDQFRKIGTKIENDLSLLKLFPHSHHRVKLLHTH